MHVTKFWWSSRPSLCTASWIIAALLTPATSQAQNALAPSSGTQASVQASVQASSTATPTPLDAATTADDASTDPVSRFLSEKGLLHSRPMVELAQHVREKATDVASDLVISAMNFLGVPYKRGGQSTDAGFDCSGFTRHVFERSVGMLLPRRASEQASMPGLTQVGKEELKPGDLVFFNTLRNTFSHVGIYIGDNKFIHSPRAGGSVRIEDMRMAYWQQRFDGARRAPLGGNKLLANNQSQRSVLSSFVNETP